MCCLFRTLVVVQEKKWRGWKKMVHIAKSVPKASNYFTRELRTEVTIFFPIAGCNASNIQGLSWTSLITGNVLLRPFRSFDLKITWIGPNFGWLIINNARLISIYSPNMNLPTQKCCFKICKNRDWVLLSPLGCKYIRCVYFSGLHADSLGSHISVYTISEALLLLENTWICQWNAPPRNVCNRQFRRVMGIIV